MARTIILLNIVLYGCVVALLGYQIYLFVFRHALPADFSDMLVYVVGLRLLFIIPSIACIFGLRRPTRWGRRFARDWNIGLGLMVGVVPFIAGAVAAFSLGVNISDVVPQGSDRIASLAAAGMFFALAAALQTKSVRHYFESHARQFSS